MNRNQVSSSSQLNIINLLDPFSLFITNNDSELMTIRELIYNIVNILELDDQLDDIIDEDKNKRLLLLSDTLERLLIKTYGIDSSYIIKPIKKSEIRNFSTSLEIFTNTYSENIEKNVEKSEISINDILLYFKNIEENRSDKNYLIKELIKYLNETSKYDDYTLLYEGIKINVGNIKSILLLLSPLLFPKENFNSYFKLTSVVLNGILSKNDVKYSEDNKISEVIINKLRNTYSSGYLLYLSKIIASIMKVYNTIIEKNDDITLNKLMLIIENNNYTLSEKYNKSTELILKTYNIKKTIKEIIEETYYIPFLVPSLINDNELYTYDEYREKIKNIEIETGNDIEKLAIQEILSSNASTTINEIIRLNNNINIDLNNAIEKYPDIVNKLLDELNTSICATIAVQIVSFPESLGKFFIDSIFLLTNGTPPENGLSSDNCNLVGEFPINIIETIFCRLKKLLKRDLLDGVEQFVINKIKNGTQRS